MQVYITPTFTQVVDDRSTSNTDPVRNKIETRLPVVQITQML